MVMFMGTLRVEDMPQGKSVISVWINLTEGEEP